MSPMEGQAHVKGALVVGLEFSSLTDEMTESMKNSVVKWLGKIPKHLVGKIRKWQDAKKWTRALCD